MKKIQKISSGFALWASTLLLTIPAVTFAALPPPPDVGLPGNSTDNITDLLTSIIMNILLPLAALVAILFLIVGGYRYMVSAGNEEQAEAGKKTIQNAIIGLIVIILSYAVVTVISNSLT